MATLNKFRSDDANNFTPASEFFGLNCVVLESVRCDFIMTSLVYYEYGNRMQEAWTKMTCFAVSCKVLCAC